MNSESNGGSKSVGSLGKGVVRTPLSLIAFFFSIVEVGLAYTTGVSSGWLQVFVVVFMCLFALCIAVSFFLVLWKRNWILYPPSEFGNASVGKYVDAMRGDKASISSIAMRGVDLALEEGNLSEISTARTIREAARTIREKVRMNVESLLVSVDSTPLRGKFGDRWEEPYEEDMPMSRFLHRIWMRLQPYPPYDYGTAWVLKDVSSGRVFVDLGVGRLGRGEAEGRSVGECGIEGGMSLEVVPATSR